MTHSLNVIPASEPRALTDAEIARARELWLKAINTRDMAAVLGVHESNVYRYINRIKPTPRYLVARA